MSNEHAFREMFKYFGEAVTPEEYDLRSGPDGPKHDFMKLPTMIMDQVTKPLAKATNSYGTRFEYFCGIVLRPERSAVVGQKNGVFCIGIYQGLLLSILELSYWLFRSPRFLSDVGAASRMTQGPPTDHASIPGGIWQHRVANGLPHFSEDLFDVPCEIRNGSAIQLMIEMVSFVVMHELAHIVCGHVGYYENVLGASYIAEIDPRRDQGTSKEQIIQRAFEHDADLNAAKNTIETNVFKYLIFQGKNAALLRRLKLIAPYLVLHLFIPNWFIRAARFEPDTTHPEPYKRAYALRKLMRTHPGMPEFRSELVQESLARDLGGFASALADPSLLIANSEFAEQLWGAEVDEEYGLARDATSVAVPYGFSTGAVAHNRKKPSAPDT